MSQFQTLTDMLSDEARDKLSFYRPGLPWAEQRKLGLPLVIATLNKAGVMAFDFEPTVGTLDFQRSVLISNYANLAPPELERIVKSTTTPSFGNFMMFADPRGITSAIKLSLGSKSQQKMANLRPIIQDILDFDRKTFGDDQVRADISIHHSIVMPNKPLTSDWHTDGSNAQAAKGAREYLIRPNMKTQTKFIFEDKSRDEEGRLADVLFGISVRHKDKPEIYQQWENALKEQGLLMIPPANSVTLMTTDTYHTSSKVDVATRSNLMRIWITPILGK